MPALRLQRGHASLLPLLVPFILRLLSIAAARGLHSHSESVAASASASAVRVDLTTVPPPKYAGYVTIDPDGSALYYAYYEASTHSEDVGEAPVVLWLQGGPGCASTFGGFYELGPFSVTPELSLQPNPGSWARIFGLLLIDQPVGTGYSWAAHPDTIPKDELGMAGHLYAALQAFFTNHRELKDRPLIIAGESYGGKYVPSIAHYILQATERAQQQDLAAGTLAPGAAADAWGRPLVRLAQRRALPPSVRRPVFNLRGIAVGNGLTDPRAQTQTLADAAYYHGLLPGALRDEVAARAQQVVGLIDAARWEEAHTLREDLRSFITNVTGLATMFSTQRTADYDPTKAVDRFLNDSYVKDMMRAKQAINYQSCSDVVRQAMGADVMQSVKALLPDVLGHVHVLLYQGALDILDGVASVSSWVDALEWQASREWSALKGELWKSRDADGPAGQKTVAGWTRSAGRLRHTVVYRAGHMVPHDQPYATQEMIEEWVFHVLDQDRDRDRDEGGSRGQQAGSSSGGGGSSSDSGGSRGRPDAVGGLEAGRGQAGDSQRQDVA